MCVVESRHCPIKVFLPEPLLQKVHPYGLLVVLGEDSPAVPLDHAGLANGTVAHDDHLRNEI